MLVHCLPSRATCTWPSSVPAYNRLARFGDSAREITVPQATMPSFLDMVMSLPFTPIVTTSSRLLWVVRSPPTASHVWPLFDDRKTRFDPANSTDALCGERVNGVSQFHRYGSSARPRARR